MLHKYLGGGLPAGTNAIHFKSMFRKRSRLIETLLHTLKQLANIPIRRLYRVLCYQLQQQGRHLDYQSALQRILI